MFFSLFIIAIFATTGNIQALFPFLAYIYFQKIVTVLPLIGIIIDNEYRGNLFKSIYSRQGKALIFLVFWIILSIPFSVYPGYSFRFVTEVYWKTLLIYCLVIAYSTTEEKYDSLIWTYIISTGLLSLWTIIYSGGSRVSIIGDSYDPNDTAFKFVLALPFALWKYLSTTGIKKYFVAVIASIILIGIVQTQSRGGFLGLIIVLALIIFQHIKYNKGKVVNILLLVLVVCGIFFVAGGTEYKSRLMTVFNPAEDYNFTSETGRLAIWKRGIDLIINNPIFGVGVQCFISAEGMMFAHEKARWNAAHNSFIQIAAELGIPGLIAFCFIIWTSLIDVWKTKFKNSIIEQHWHITSFPILCSWIGFIVAGSFLSSAYTTSFYFLLAITSAFINLGNRRKLDIKVQIG